ncbi:MAG: hypothetical protein Q9207_003860 [Kuettlingeria erythrocarpa]
MSRIEKVEFRTVDEITLRGHLYLASEYGPGVVLSPGFNCVKEMLGLPDVARSFQEAGITSLVYDPRSTGDSDGSPRNDIDPVMQTEDYSDALTFLASVPHVAPDRIGLWGMSFAGTVSLCAASLDRRVKFVIAVCPLTLLESTPEMFLKVLTKCLQDRESRVAGNPPYYLPMLTNKGENPAGFGLGIDQEQYGRIVNAGKQLARNHVNRTTIQTYYRLLMWQPFPLWRHLGPTPAMFVVPELDKVSPKENQVCHFEALSGPKTLHIEHDRGHMDILEGDHLAALMKQQISFISGVFGISAKT